jgi:hypothetical protein
VSVEFDFVQAGVRHVYEVTRSWIATNATAESVEVSLDLRRDGQRLDDLDHAHWDDFLKELIPPGGNLRILFAFDVLGLLVLVYFFVDGLRTATSGGDYMGVWMPILLVPGFAASMPADSSTVDEWLTHRGISPDKLQVDPVGDTYQDLLQTLRNAGYRDHADTSDPGNPRDAAGIATWRLSGFGDTQCRELAQAHFCVGGKKHLGSPRLVVSRWGSGISGSRARADHRRSETNHGVERLGGGPCLRAQLFGPTKPGARFYAGVVVAVERCRI